MDVQSTTQQHPPRQIGHDVLTPPIHEGLPGFFGVLSNEPTKKEHKQTWFWKPKTSKKKRLTLLWLQWDLHPSNIVVSIFFGGRGATVIP